MLGRPNKNVHLCSQLGGHQESRAPVDTCCSMVSELWLTPVVLLPLGLPFWAEPIVIRPLPTLPQGRERPFELLMREHEVSLESISESLRKEVPEHTGGSTRRRGPQRRRDM